MEEKDINPPFPREPWKRLLEDAGDAPAGHDGRAHPRERAQSRDAACHALVGTCGARGKLCGRGRDRTGVVWRGWRGSHRRIQGRGRSRRSAQGDQLPAITGCGGCPDAERCATGDRRGRTVETDDYAEPDAGEVSEIEVTGSRIGGPERERRAASEAPEEAIRHEPATDSDDRSAGYGGGTGAIRRSRQRIRATAPARRSRQAGVLAENAR